MKELMWDDFTETTLSNQWGSPGNQMGAGKNAEGALWAPWHVTLSNSCLNLDAYQDTTLIGQWGVTTAESSAVDNWVAGETGTSPTIPLGYGTRILTAMRADSVPGLTAIALITALSDHKSEGDFVEINAPLTTNWATVHYGNGEQLAEYGLACNLAQWGVWGIQWDASTIEFLVQTSPTGPISVWKSYPNPDPTGTWAEEQFLSLQYQTNDSIYGANTPAFPVNSPSITAQNPARQQHDWVQICTGGS
jgi:hypothetical protein